MNGIPLDDPAKYLKAVTKKREKMKQAKRLKYVDEFGNEIICAEPEEKISDLNLKTNSSVSQKIDGYSPMLNKTSTIILTNPGYVSLKKLHVRNNKFDKLF